ncbi:hypothetical protein OHC33_001591 [Knufia fluminis]|uniref:Uncharacterized protein n=1 Tax=Knufia fluminis TaxID=191047 RepID=A0AAN8EMX0_9EURO|nr:hypothetical protein OHC33_001591 [Knufia fluminis]
MNRAKAKRDAEEKAKKDKEHAQRAAAVKEAVQKRNPPPQGSANPQASARPQHRQNRRLLPATSNTYPSLEPYPNPLFPRVNQGTTTFDGTHQSLPQDQPPARHPNADPLRSTTLPPPPPPPPSERPPQSRPFGRAPTWPDDVLNPSTPAPSSSQLAYRPARQPRAPTWPNDVLNPSTPAPSGPQLEHRPAPPPTTGGSGNSNTQGRTDRRRTRPRTDSPASTGNTPEPGTSQQQRGSGQPATKYQKKK